MPTGLTFPRPQQDGTLMEWSQGQAGPSARLSLKGMSGPILTIAGTFTDLRTWTVPDRSDTFAGLGAQTFIGNQTFTGTIKAASLSISGSAVYPLQAVTGGFVPPLQVNGVSAGTASAALGRWTNDANFSIIYFNKSRSGTVGTHTIVNNGDILGRINFAGSDGTEFADAAFLEVGVDAAPSAGIMPGFARVRTYNTSGVVASAMTWSSAQLTTAHGNLSVAGTTEASAVGTASMITAGGLGVAKRSFLGTIATTFSGNVIAGVQDGTADVAGAVGETLNSTVTAAAAGATGVAANATSVSVTRGKWMGRASVTISGGATGLTNGSTFKVSISTTSATNGTNGSTMVQQTVHSLVANGLHSLSINIPDINISAAATYFLVVDCTYAAGSPTIAGSLTFTRAR